MHMNHAAFTRSRALRCSLKRGLARQAIAVAARSAPDLPFLFRSAFEMRPNAKGVERLALRMKDRPGVVRVASAHNGKRLLFITRSVREVEARVEGETVFKETGLIYLRVVVGLAAHRIAFNLTAVSFCAHALERLVERSDHDLQASLLPHIDAEAQAIFRAWDSAALIEEGGDEFYRAATPGLWAGGHDEMALEPDWNLSTATGRLPIFSARTFLSEAEMRPSVWLRWKDDPACRMM